PLQLSTMSKTNAGEIRLNHQVGSYLPGFADNAVYNLLRLQPGVMAAGEQSNDLIVWGSYKGQTEVLFDGFTLFGLKNFNDNIGIVNPYMVKDVKLLKGAYPARYGGKAGGIVDITGTNGNKIKPELILSATNMTVNSKLSVPVTPRSAVSVAFRQTYYNLYKDVDLNFIKSRRINAGDLVDLSVSPDYMFRDFTAKYAGVTKSGDSFYIDILRGVDKFNYLVNFDMNDRDIKNSATETHSQTGSSAFYGKVWDNGNTTNVTLSYSDLSHHLLNQTSFMTHSMHSKMWRYEDVQNRITKARAVIDQKVRINQNHTLEMGVGMLSYSITLSEDTIKQNLFTDNTKTLSVEGFVQDRITVNNRLNFIAGMRVDAPLLLNKTLLQPRLSMSYKLASKLWFKAAWGRYDQYVVQSSVLDEAGNYRYFWALSNGEDVPLQTAQHFTAGLNYQGSFLSFGLEAYNKKLQGLTRYVYQPNRIDRNVYTGEGITRGVDFLLEGRYKNHSAWIAYTLSQSVERFTYFQHYTYRRAPQDQRHEIKMAVLLDFHPFYFSSNYVYGSGFPDRSIKNFQRNTTDIRYSRWDISGVYRWSLKKFELNMGLSILNVLNTQNIKLQNFVKIPSVPGSSVNILAEAVPFTPTIFLLLRL
ncbi:MAG: TonB-dependent receptor plug domain-containing protein, partial [Bacteroidales bacterium]|nr:TonB-dependent receptor plug domain-containing protein [Bacteroidales bacterium]